MQVLLSNEIASLFHWSYIPHRPTMTRLKRKLVI